MQLPEMVLIVEKWFSASDSIGSKQKQAKEVEPYCVVLLDDKQVGCSEKYPSNPISVVPNRLGSCLTLRFYERSSELAPLSVRSRVDHSGFFTARTSCSPPLSQRSLPSPTSPSKAQPMSPLPLLDEPSCEEETNIQTEKICSDSETVAGMEGEEVQTDRQEDLQLAMPSNQPAENMQQIVQRDDSSIMAEVSFPLRKLVNFGAPLYTSLCLGLNTGRNTKDISNLTEALNMSVDPKVPKITITLYKPLRIPDKGSRPAPDIRAALTEDLDVCGLPIGDAVPGKMQVQGVIECIKVANRRNVVLGDRVLQLQDQVISLEGQKQLVEAEWSRKFSQMVEASSPDRRSITLGRKQFDSDHDMLLQRISEHEDRHQQQSIRIQHLEHENARLQQCSLLVEGKLESLRHENNIMHQQLANGQRAIPGPDGFVQRDSSKEQETIEDALAEIGRLRLELQELRETQSQKEVGGPQAHAACILDTSHVQRYALTPRAFGEEVSREEYEELLKQLSNAISELEIYRSNDLRQGQLQAREVEVISNSVKPGMSETEVTMLAERLARVDAELQMLRDSEVQRLRLLEQDCAEAHREIQDMRYLEQRCADANRQLKHDHDRDAKLLESSCHQQHGLQANITRLDQELTDARQTLENRDSLLKETKHQRSELQALLNKRSTEPNDLQAEVALQRDHAMDALQEALSQGRVLDGSLRTAEVAEARVEKKLATCEAELAQWKNMTEESSAMRKELENKFENSLRSMMEEDKKHSVEMQSSATALEEVQALRVLSLNQSEDLQQEFHMSKVQIQSCEIENQKLRGQLEDTRAEMVANMQRLKGQQYEAFQALQDAEQAEARLAEHRERRMLEQLAHADTELSALADDDRRLRLLAELKASEEQQLSLQHTVARFKPEMESLRVAVEHRQELIDEGTRTHAQLRTLCSKTEAQSAAHLAALQEENRTQQDQLEYTIAEFERLREVMDEHSSKLELEMNEQSAVLRAAKEELSEAHLNEQLIVQEKFKQCHEELQGLRGIEQQHTALKSDLINIQQKHGFAERELSELREQVGQKTRALQCLQESHRQGDVQTQALNEELIKAVTKAQELDDIQIHQIRLEAELTEEKQQAQTAEQRAQEVLEQTSAQLQAVQEQCANLVKQADTNKDDTANLALQNKELQAALEGHRSALDEKSSLAASHLSAWQQSEAAAGTLQHEFNAIRSASKELTEQNASALTELHSFRMREEVQSQMNQQINSQLRNLHVEYQQNEMALAGARTELHTLQISLEGEVRDSQMRLQEQSSAFTGLEKAKKVSLLQSERACQELHEENANLRLELMAPQALPQVQELVQQCQRQQQELLESTQEHQALRSRVARANLLQSTWVEELQAAKKRQAGQSLTGTGGNCESSGSGGDAGNNTELQKELLMMAEAAEKLQEELADRHKQCVSLEGAHADALAEIKVHSLGEHESLLSAEKHCQELLDESDSLRSELYTLKDREKAQLKNFREENQRQQMTLETANTKLTALQTSETLCRDLEVQLEKRSAALEEVRASQTRRSLDSVLSQASGLFRQSKEVQSLHSELLEAQGTNEQLKAECTHHKRLLSSAESLHSEALVQATARYDTEKETLAKAELHCQELLHANKCLPAPEGRDGVDLQGLREKTAQQKAELANLRNELKQREGRDFELQEKLRMAVSALEELQEAKIPSLLNEEESLKPSRSSSSTEAPVGNVTIQQVRDIGKLDAQSQEKTFLQKDLAALCDEFAVLRQVSQKQLQELHLICAVRSEEADASDGQRSRQSSQQMDEKERSKFVAQLEALNSKREILEEKLAVLSAASRRIGAAALTATMEADITELRRQFQQDVAAQERCLLEMKLAHVQALSGQTKEDYDNLRTAHKALLFENAHLEQRVESLNSQKKEVPVSPRPVTPSMSTSSVADDFTPRAVQGKLANKDRETLEEELVVLRAENRASVAKISSLREDKSALQVRVAELRSSLEKAHLVGEINSSSANALADANTMLLQTQLAEFQHRCEELHGELKEQRFGKLSGLPQEGGNAKCDMVVLRLFRRLLWERLSLKTSDEIAKLLKMDTRSSTVPRAEVEKFLKQYKKFRDDFDMQKAFQKLDAQHTGRLAFDEFPQVLSRNLTIDSDTSDYLYTTLDSICHGLHPLTARMPVLSGAEVGYISEDHFVRLLNSPCLG